MFSCGYLAKASLETGTIFIFIDQDEHRWVMFECFIESDSSARIDALQFIRLLAI